MDQTGARREVKGPLRRLQPRLAPGVIQQEGTAQPFPLPFPPSSPCSCPMFHPRAYLMSSREHSMAAWLLLPDFLSGSFWKEGRGMKGRPAGQHDCGGEAEVQGL